MNNEDVKDEDVVDEGEKTEGAKRGPKPKSSRKVRNPNMANNSCYGITGQKITFDSQGAAELDEAEFNHFKKVPGFHVVT